MRREEEGALAEINLISSPYLKPLGSVTSHHLNFAETLGQTQIKKPSSSLSERQRGSLGFFITSGKIVHTAERNDGAAAARGKGVGTAQARLWENFSYARQPSWMENRGTSRNSGKCPGPR